MTTPPSWVMAIIFWLHMLATVAWIGSLVAISILVLPASKRTLKPVDQLSFVAAVQKRLEPIMGISLGLLIVTGLIQLSTSPHYDGFLSLSTQWSMAMLVKHVLVAILIVVSAIHSWEVLPAIHRILLRKDKAGAEQLGILNRREGILLRINLVLGALILLATAVARVS